MKRFNNYKTLIAYFSHVGENIANGQIVVLDKYDFSNKTIIPFCTNDEEYFGISLLELQSHCKGANIKERLVIREVNVDSSDKIIEEFVKRQ